MNLYFTSKIRDCLDLLGTPMALQTCLSQICKEGVQFQIEIRKISRRRPRSVDDAELGHFTLLLCRGRHGNVQRFITHVHNYYFADYTFCFLPRSRCRRRRDLLKVHITPKFVFR